MKRGAPGGWGTPIIWDVAMNSPQSQNGTEGETVFTYTAKDMRNKIQAMMRFRIRSALSFMSISPFYRSYPVRFMQRVIKCKYAKKSCKYRFKRKKSQGKSSYFCDETFSLTFLPGYRAQQRCNQIFFFWEKCSTISLFYCIIKVCFSVTFYVHCSTWLQLRCAKYEKPCVVRKTAGFYPFL